MAPGHERDENNIQINQKGYLFYLNTKPRLDKCQKLMSLLSYLA